MLMNDFLATRNSTREFKNKEFSDDLINEISQILKEESKLIKNEKAGFILKTDGDKIFKALNGIGGYEGLMIEAPYYIALNTLEDDPISFIEGAYYMEDVVSKLKEKEIGFCWVTIKGLNEDILKRLFGNEEGRIDYLLAIGYPKEESRPHKFDERIGIDKIVFIDDLKTPATVEELENRGLDQLFYYLRYVPSTLNKQPWRFLIEDNTVKLYVKDYSGIENLIDSGIIMYYFTRLAESLAIKANWDINPSLNDEEYKFIANTNI